MHEHGADRGHPLLLWLQLQRSFGQWYISLWLSKQANLIRSLQEEDFMGSFLQSRILPPRNWSRDVFFFFPWLLSFIQTHPFHIITIVWVECKPLMIGFQKLWMVTRGRWSSPFLARGGDPCRGHCHCMCAPKGTDSWLSIQAVQFERFTLQMAAGLPVMIPVFAECSCVHRWTKLPFMPMNTSELKANLFQYETIHAATFWHSFCSNYSYFFSLLH